MTSKRTRDLEPGDVIVSWLGREAEIIAVTLDDGDVVVGVRPSDQERLGPYDRLARFDGDEEVEVRDR
jgi:hypothetical protein